MLHSLEEVLHQVNSLLKARGVIEFLGFHADAASQIGSSLKCHCPVHRGDNFKTLTVDLRNGTCQCIVRDCPVHERRNLVELVAYAKDILPEQAAVLLAQKFRLPLEGNLEFLATQELLDDAERLESAGQSEEAAQRFHAALSITPRAEDVLVRVTAGLLRLGRNEEVLRLRLQHAHRLRQGDALRAIGFLQQHVTQLAQDDPEVLGELVACYRLVEPHGKTWAELLWKRAAIHRAAGRPKDAQADYLEALRQFEDDADRHDEVGTLLEEMGRLSDARREFWRAAGLYEAQGDDAQAVARLEKLADMDPTDHACREKLLELRERLGDMQSYLQDLAHLGEESLAAGDIERAENCFSGLLRRVPDHEAALDGLALTARARGDSNAAAMHLIALARVLFFSKRQSEAKGKLEPLAANLPASPEVALELAELYSLMGEDDAAARCFTHSAELLLEQNQRVRAQESLGKAAGFNSGSVETNWSISRISLELQAYGSAALHGARAARLALAAGDHAKAEELAEEALQELDPAHASELHRVIQEVWQLRGDKDKATEAYFQEIRALGIAQSREELGEALARSEDFLAQRWDDYLKLALVLTGVNAREDARNLITHFLHCCLQKDDVTNALSACEFLLPAAPDDYDNKRTYARLLYTNGDTARARDVYVEAVQALLQERRGREALSMADEALGYFPQEHALEFARVESLLRTERYREARKAAERLLRRLQESDRLSEAVDLCRLAVRSIDSPGEWREKLAEALLASGDRGSALAEFRSLVKDGHGVDDKALRFQERIVELLPDSVEELETLAEMQYAIAGSGVGRPLMLRAFEMLFAVNTPAEALAAKRARINELDPDFHQLTCRYAEYLRENGDENKAFAELEGLALRLKENGECEELCVILGTLHQWRPHDPELMMRWAECADQSGDTEEAVRVAYLAADHFQAMDDWDEAIRAFELIIRRRPLDPEPRLRLVDVYLELDLHEKAEALLKELSSIYEEREEFALQRMVLERAIALNHHSVDLRLSLIRTLRSLGDQQRAEAERLSLAAIYIQRGEARDAAALLADLSAEMQTSTRARALSLEVSLLAGDCAEVADRALAVISDLQSNGRTGDASSLLEKCVDLLAENERHEEVSSLTSALEDIAGSSAAMAGRAAMALEKSEPEKSARLRLTEADWHERDGDHVAALHAVEQALKLRHSLHSRERYLTLFSRVHPARSEQIAHLEQEVAQLKAVSGDIAGALVHLNRALELRHDDPRLLCEVARLYAESREFDVAAGLLDRADALLEQIPDPALERQVLEIRILLNPYDKVVLLRLIDIARDEKGTEEAARLLHRLADLHSAEGDFLKAIELYDRVAESDPHDISSREHLFQLLLAAGEPQRATARLREVVRLHLNAGNLAQGVETLRQAESVDPDDPSTLEQLGHLYHLIHDIDLAARYLIAAARRFAVREEFAEALRLSAEVKRLIPSMKDALALRADIFLAQQKESEAVGELQEFAEVLVREEAWEDAVRCYERMIRLQPESTELRSRFAHLLSDLDRTDEAVEQFLLLSSTWNQQGKPEDAIDAAKTAVKLKPDDLDAHSVLADLLMKCGTPDAACMEILWLVDYHEKNLEYESALMHLRRSPDFNESSYLQMRAAGLKKSIGEKEEASALLWGVVDEAENSGDQETAERALSTLFDLNPGDARARQKLTQLLLATGRRDHARGLAMLSFRFLLNHGEVESAQAVIHDALQWVDDPASFRAEAADAYADGGVPEAAVAEYIELARQLQEDGELERALGYVEHALEVSQSDVQALELRITLLQRLDRRTEAGTRALELIETYVRWGETDRAIALAQSLVQMAPQNIEYRRRLVDLLRGTQRNQTLIEELRQLADLQLQQEDLKSAVETLRSLLSIKPDDTRARVYYIDAYRQVGDERDLVGDYLKLARIHAKHKALMEATRVYEKALLVAPEASAVHREFIQYLLENGQTSRALQQSYELAQIQMKGGTFKEAFETLDELSAQAENDPQFYCLRARALLGMRARGGSVRDFTMALQLYSAAGDVQNELEITRELVAVDPENVEVRQEFIRKLRDAGRRDDCLREMRALAELFVRKEHYDLAAAQFREALQLDPESTDTWRALCDTHARMSTMEEVVEDCVRLGESLARGGRHREAVEFFQRAMYANPANIAARRGFVMYYPRVGRLRDIIEEVIFLAQQLVESGAVDEGISYFQLALSVDPNNTVARDMLSATQSRHDAEVRRRTAQVDHSPISTTDTQDRSATGTGTRGRVVTAASDTPSDFLAGELDEIDAREERETLQQVVNNYRDIIAVNTLNAAVRVKLAEVLEQMGKRDEALKELALATEIFFRKDELPQCVNACEFFLTLNPRDQIIRKRLNEAILKRTAMKALESSILFAEDGDRPE